MNTAKHVKERETKKSKMRARGITMIDVEFQPGKKEQEEISEVGNGFTQNGVPSAERLLSLGVRE